MLKQYTLINALLLLKEYIEKKQYKRHQLLHVEQFIEDDDKDCDKENEPDCVPTSMWLDSVNKIGPLFKDH